jgi:tetratricopeptide (TPR) repeat protein
MPTSSVPGVTGDALREYDRAVARYREGDFAGALQGFDRVLASGPYPEPRGVWLHAYAALAVGDADRAVELGDALLGAASSRSESYELAAVARLFRGDPIGALAALRRASELEGRSPRQWTYRALAYEMLGQSEERRVACGKGDNDFAATLRDRSDDVLLHLERASLLAFCGNAPDQLVRTLAVVRERLPKVDEESMVVSPKRIERFTLPVFEAVSAAAKGDAAAAVPRLTEALRRGDDAPRFDRAEALFLAKKVAEAAGLGDAAARWEQEGKALDPKGPYFGTFVQAEPPPAAKKPAVPGKVKRRKPSSEGDDESDDAWEPRRENEDG